MIKTICIYALACFVGLWVQSTLISTLTTSPYTITPDIILVLVCCVGLQIKNPKGALLAFLLGMMSDFASAKFVGPAAAGMVVAYFSVVAISANVFADRALAICGIVFIASLLKSFVYALFLFMYVQDYEFSFQVVQFIAIETLLNVIISPFLIKFLIWVRGESDSAGMVGRCAY